MDLLLNSGELFTQSQQKALLPSMPEFRNWRSTGSVELKLRFSLFALITSSLTRPVFRVEAISWPRPLARPAELNAPKCFPVGLRSDHSWEGVWASLFFFFVLGPMTSWPAVYQPGRLDRLPFLASSFPSPPLPSLFSRQMDGLAAAPFSIRVTLCCQQLWHVFFSSLPSSIAEPHVDAHSSRMSDRKPLTLCSPSFSHASSVTTFAHSEKLRRKLLSSPHFCGD